MKYLIKFTLGYLINNPRMFNGTIVDLAEKPYIQQKFLLQWICCKCLAGCYRHSYFWPQRSWRLLEAKNTPRRPKLSWKSWFIEKSIYWKFLSTLKNPLVDPIRFGLWPPQGKIFLFLRPKMRGNDFQKIAI